MASSGATAPPERCAQKVTAQEARARVMNGSFSRNRRQNVAGCKRDNGHQSSSNNTNGSVTSIGLLISPQAKKNRESRYQREPRGGGRLARAALRSAAGSVHFE